MQILDGGEDAGPLADRRILAELRNPSTIEAARKLTTTGRFTGDICRCPGDTTIALHDDSGVLITSASLHGYGNISWERQRLHNDLHMADPAALHLLLATHGVPDQIPLFLRGRLQTFGSIYVLGPFGDRFAGSRYIGIAR
ncbi:hypothetical protein ABZ436_29545, partial [Micromonospora matsumotoense]|uniref:hypothetical protein n=1 Tax=Micromonospora matsumotoense TaxID=121616 RepID=UPI00340D9163